MTESVQMLEKESSVNEAAAEVMCPTGVDGQTNRGQDMVTATSMKSNGSSAETSDHVEDLNKVTVFNVGKYVTRVQLEKLLNENGIEFKKAKKTPHTSHAVLSFHTEEQRTAGMAKLGKVHGLKGGGLMKAVLTQHHSKRKGSFGEGDGQGPKRHRQDGDDKEVKTVAQATASLYGLKTYDEQLTFKQETLMSEVFLRIPMMVRNDWHKRLTGWRRKPENAGGKGRARPLPPASLVCPAWCRSFRKEDGVVPFDVLPMVPSPEQEGYRNKCEFTLGHSEDGLATTGFRHGKFDPGVPFKVESPKDCPQVHAKMKALCVQMDSFMRTSPFPPYEDKRRTGVWRFLLVRRSVVDDEIMAKVVVKITGIEDADAWKREEERLVKELSKGADGEGGTKLVSLWLQEFDGVSAPDEKTPLRLIWGKDRVEEALLGLRFTVSPNSFFQVNTRGAEALYNVVIENLELGEDVILMDVCCGAGTIGICAAASGGAKKVFGVDLCQQAIEDAARNAAANGIEGCEFACGKAEDVVAKQLDEAYELHRERMKADSGAEEEEKSKDSAHPDVPQKVAPRKPKFAAVIDPPRSGVHAKCLRALRATQAIQRLVYVSCNPTKSLPGDALLLCSAVSNNTTGLPFRPVKAIPVDMFPHTPHIELVMVFERVEKKPSDESDSRRRSEADDKAATHAEPSSVACSDRGVEKTSVKSSVPGDAAGGQDERDRSESKSGPEGE